MKADESVKKGQETNTQGSSIHAKGKFVFQIQEGFEYKINHEKENGPSYTVMGLPMKSIDGIGGTKDGVGGFFSLRNANVAYHNDDQQLVANNMGKQKNWTVFSGILVHTGIAAEGEDIPIENENYWDQLKIKLPNKLVGLEIVWGKDKYEKKKDENGNLVDIPEAEQKTFDVALVASVFPVDGASSTDAGTTPDVDPDGGWE